jgi:hypothetical protein
MMLEMLSRSGAYSWSVVAVELVCLRVGLVCLRVALVLMEELVAVPVVEVAQVHCRLFLAGK